MQNRTLRFTFFALFCGMLISSNEVRAQAKGTTTMKTSIPRAAEKPWNVELALEVGSSLYKQDSYERRTEEAFAIAPIYRFSEKWSLAGNTVLVKDDSIEGNGNSAFGNTNVMLNYSHKLNPHLAWRNSLGGTLPTNPEMREQTTYQGTVKASTGVSFKGLVFGSTLSTGVSASRNFHEYNIDANGGFNMRDGLGLSLGYDLPLSQTFSLTTSFAYSAGHAYSDDLRTKFSFEAGVNWSPTKELNIGLGTSNDGSALQPNGRDSNVEFFDNNTSVVKMSLAYTL